MTGFVTSEPGSDPIVVESRIEASPSQVFRAWTDPEIVVIWFGTQDQPLTDAAVDLRPGGSWRFVERTASGTDAWFEGRYLEIVRDERLVLTWRKVTIDRSGQRQQTPTSIVEIDFQPVGSGTELRVTHSNLDSDSRVWFRYGWNHGVEKLIALFPVQPASR